MSYGKNVSARSQREHDCAAIRITFADTSQDTLSLHNSLCTIDVTERAISSMIITDDAETETADCSQVEASQLAMQRDRSIYARYV